MITCPNCGKENQDHYKFCLGCGSDLPRPEAAVPARQPTPTPPTGIPSPGPGPSPMPYQPGPTQPASPATSVAQTAVASSARGQASQALPATAPHPVQPGAHAPHTAPAPLPPIEHQPAPTPTEPPGPPPPVEEQQSRPCVECGSPIPPGFAFCGSCGAAVPGAAPASPLGKEVLKEGFARLVLIQPDGSEGGHVEIPTSEVAVGRDAGGFFENNPFLSPTHAIFVTKNDTVLVRDAGSLNGIYVKVAPHTPVEIKSGNIFRMGQELMLFEEIDRGSIAPDGTARMGSPIEGLWGRVALIVGQGRLGNAFPVGGDGIVAGRERGNILFPEDGYVSGIHLRLHAEGKKYFITDLGSSNGSFVKVSGQARLKNGSFLLMGQQLFRVDV